jgi:anti-sigma factor (TIGR02949 family)
MQKIVALIVVKTMYELARITCEEVIPSVILFIDHELPDEAQYIVFEIHFQQCPPCCQVMEHERSSIELIQNRLRSSCNEEVPPGLHQRIREQTQRLSEESQEQFISQRTVTEISVPGFASIQITQEFTQHIRHDF